MKCQKNVWELPDITSHRSRCSTISPTFLLRKWIQRWTDHAVHILLLHVGFKCAGNTSGIEKDMSRVQELPQVNVQVLAYLSSCPWKEGCWSSRDTGDSFCPGPQRSTAQAQSHQEDSGAPCTAWWLRSGEDCKSRHSGSSGACWAWPADTY